MAIKTLKEISTAVKPKASGLLRDGRPKVGMDPDGQESDRLVIADVVAKFSTPSGDITTPAGSLSNRPPRGALLTKVNDEPVKTWPQLVRRPRRALPPGVHVRRARITRRSVCSNAVGEAWP